MRLNWWKKQTVMFANRDDRRSLMAAMKNTQNDVCAVLLTPKHYTDSLFCDMSVGLWLYRLSM